MPVKFKFNTLWDDNHDVALTMFASLLATIKSQTILLPRIAQQ